jgi:hypothetical protein
VRLLILDPLWKGFLLAFFSVVAATLGASFVLAEIPPPSPELMRTIATAGVGLVIAYVVEAVWLAQRVVAEDDDEHEEWLGFLTGVGLAGLLGIVSALLVAEHRAVGHDNLLDHLGVGWSAVSMVILGGVLVLQPILAGRMARRPDAVAPDADKRAPGL